MPRTLRSLVTTALAAALAISSVASCVPAGEPPSSAWLPDIADSSELTGPILVRGVLVDASGRPTSGLVWVLAWPPPEVMARLEVGDTVETAPVARARVGSDGTFVLRVDPKVPLTKFMAPDGTVNFELLGESETGWATFSFPRRLELSPTPTWVDPVSARPESAAAEILEVTLQLGPPPQD